MYAEITMNKQKYKPINPLRIGWQECEPSHAFGPRINEYYIIHFVESGKGYFRNETGEYYLSKNDCFVIRPGEVYYYEADAKEPWFYIWIAWEDVTLVPNNIRQGGVFHNEGLRRCFLPLLNIKQDESEGREEYCCGKIFELYQILQPQKSYNEYIERSIMIMQENVATPILISDIAKQLHLDRGYYSTLFTSKVGQSPKEYYLNLRLEHAKRMLNNGDMNVGQVSRAVGFQSVSSFSRVYKEKYGASPKSARKEKSL